MSRRIDVELTSSREDGTWTWRAAGAKQPKGSLDGALLWDGASVGDECRVEAEFLLDGIEIIEVFAPKKKKERTDLLEMKSRPLRDDELVTEVRAPGGRGGRRGRDGGRGRGGREGGRGRDGGRDRDGARSNDGRREGGRSERGSRRPPADAKPKPKRLRPRRVHRDAVMSSIPEEHRPIAEQVLQGGIPAVRSAIEKQNAEAKSGGAPEVPVAGVLSIAEPLVPLLRTAEWRDRADAALADMAELDLRDLRSVVVAADGAAKDDETRGLAEQLKTGLNERIEKDQAEWMSDLQRAVSEGRTVRALRLSSRPVKAGSPLPPELARTLADAAGAALAADVAQDRWATVLDAVAFSPIRSGVTPAGYPAEPSTELLDAVRRVADRVPSVAAHFGIDPAEAAKAKRRRPPRKRSGAKKPPPPASTPDSPATDATSSPTEATTEATVDAPVAQEETPTVASDPVPAAIEVVRPEPEAGAETDASAETVGEPIADDVPSAEEAAATEET